MNPHLCQFPNKPAKTVGIHRRIGILALLVCLTALPASGLKPKRVVLKTGQPIPQFTGVGDNGEPWRSKDHVTKKILIVYFFPADFLNTTTKQAVQFSADIKQLREKGVEVVGISPDSVATHKRFKEAHKLDFTLISDEQGNIARQFGVQVRTGGTIRPRSGPPITRKATFSWKVVAVDKRGKIVLNKARISSLLDVNAVFRIRAKDFWSNRADKKAVWIPQRERDWRRLLSRKAFMITRKSKTERKFTGKYNRVKAKGQYRCVGCGLVLFDSRTKYDSGTGWPAFWNPATRDCLSFANDRSNGAFRIEVKCKRCAAHLGHVFDDGPAPTGKRYCINSAALVLDRTQVSRASDEQVTGRASEGRT